MTDQPKEIERQIDETRNEMDETIDALSDRLNLRRMGQRAADAALQRAPTPPEGGRSFYLRRPFLVGSVAMAAGLGAGYLLSPPDTPERPKRSKSTDGQGMMSKTKGAYEEAKHQVKDAAHGLGGTMRHVADVTKERTRDMKERIQHEQRDVSAETRKGAHNVQSETKEAARNIRSETQEAARNIRSETQDAARDIRQETKAEAARRNVTPEGLKARAQDARKAAKE